MRGPGVHHGAGGLASFIGFFLISFPSCVVFCGRYAPVEGFSFRKHHQYPFLARVILPLRGFTDLLTCPFGISNI